MGMTCNAFCAFCVCEQPSGPGRLFYRCLVPHVGGSSICKPLFVVQVMASSLALWLFYSADVALHEPNASNFPCRRPGTICVQRGLNPPGNQSEGLTETDELPAHFLC